MVHLHRTLWRRNGRTVIHVRMPGALGNLIKDRLWILEREIVQEHHHFLAVLNNVFCAAHDERCSKEVHFLGRHVAVHPVGARQRLEIIVPGFARHELGAWQIRNAVLDIGRYLPVPVNDGFNVEGILQGELKSFAGIEDKSLTAARAGDTVDGGGPSVDLDGASSDRELARRFLSPTYARKDSGCRKRGSCREKATAGQHVCHLNSPIDALKRRDCTLPLVRRRVRRGSDCVSEGAGQVREQKRLDPSHEAGQISGSEPEANASSPAQTADRPLHMRSRTAYRGAARTCGDRFHDWSRTSPSRR